MSEQAGQNENDATVSKNALKKQAKADKKAAKKQEVSWFELNFQKLFYLSVLLFSCYLIYRY